MSQEMVRVLLLEDNPGDARLCQEMLNGVNPSSWQLEQAGTLKEGLELLARDEFDLALLDLNLPDSKGLETFKAFAQAAMDLPIVIMSGLDDQEEALQAVHQGAQDYLLKDDLTPGLLARALYYALERHQLTSQMEILAITDNLSGLLNRRGFFTLAEQQIKLARRTHNNMSLFFMDIDDMKSINDSFGHLKGDLAISATAEALRRTFRESDLLARMGGDEFAALAIDTPVDSQQGIYQRLLDNLQQVKEDQDLPFEISVSVGAAEWNIQETQNLELLLHQADQSMYAQKRGETIFSEPELEAPQPFKEQPPFFSERLDVLLLEDNPGDAKLVEAFLAESDLETNITWVDRLDQLQSLPREKRFSVALLDLTLPDSHGIDTITSVREAFPEVPIVVFTGRDDNQIALEAIQAGSQDFLVKGSFDAEVLQRSLHYAVERNNLLQQNQSFLKEIHRSEQILQSIFDHIKIGIFRADQKGELTFANRVMVDLLGFDSLTEVIGRKILKDHLGLAQEMVSALAAGQRELKGESLVLKGIDGRTVPIRLGISRSLDDGEPILTGTIEDISLQVESEEQLNLQASALNAAANAILITDTQGKILWCNQAVGDLTGYTSLELIGRTPAIFNSGKQSSEFYTTMWEAISAGRVWQGELVNKRKNGSTYTERMTITPLRGQNKDITHYIAIKEDITGLLQNQAALQRRLDEVTTLHQVAIAGIEETDEDRLISRVTEIVGKMIYSDHFGVLLLDRAGEYLQVHDSYQGIREDIEGLVFSIQEGIVGRCVRQGVSILVEDVSQDKDFISATPGVKCELAVPLIAEGQLIGVINAESKQPFRFSAEDARLLETIASQLGTAISHIRVHGLERTQRQIAETLSEIALVLNSSLEIDQILDQVLIKIAELIPYTTASLFLCRGGKARVMRMRGFEELGLQDWIYHFNLDLDKTGIQGIDQLIQDKQPQLVMDTQNYPDWAEIPETSYIRSYLGIPILKNDTLLGFINLDHEQPNAFDESHISIMVALANQLSTALDNAQLYRQQHEQVEFLESLRQIDYAITSSMDLQVTLTVIMTEVMQRLEVDAVDIVLYDPETNQIYPGGWRGFKLTDPYQDIPFSVEGLLNSIIQKREACFVRDLEKTNQPVTRRILFGEEGFRAYYGLPLIAKGKIVGVMELYRRQPTGTEEDWQRYAETVATQTAIAVDNSQLFSNLQQANLELSLAYDTTLEGWAGALELRDHETEGHSRRVVDLTMKLAEAMGVPEEQWIHLRRGALLHDIGKMGVPDRILQKPGSLTEEEKEIMRQHPLFAEKWLKEIPYLRPALDIPLYHHERWDGTGYPHGLKGGQIPLAARIFAVIDVWDALRSDRPYRDAWPIDKVLQHIRDQSGKHFDPAVVEAFLKLIEREFPADSPEHLALAETRSQ